MRYFFNVRSNGRLVRDLEGAEYATGAEAQAEALSIARELIGRQLIGGDAVDWASIIDIEQENGELAGFVSFLQAAGLPWASAPAEIPPQ